jgi:hypothetical protein
VPLSLANSNDARSDVNRVCPISNGLTAVAVRRDERVENREGEIRGKRRTRGKY